MLCVNCGAAETEGLLCPSCWEALDNHWRENYALAERYQLGKPLQQFSPGEGVINAAIRRYQVFLILLLLITTIGGIVLTLIGFWTQSPQNQFPVAILLGVDLLCFAYVLYKLKVLLPCRRLQVLICTYGFLHRDSRRTEAFRWDQVVVVERTHWELAGKRRFGEVDTPTRIKIDSYMVRRKDGVQVRYVKSMLATLFQLGQTLETEARRFGVPVRLNSNV